MESHPFRLLRNIGRTRQIVTVLLNHGFGDVVDRIGLRSVWQRWKCFLFRRKEAPLPRLKTVERVRLTLESLGPTFIKFGQVMSTRPDLVPADMLAELKKLQERVPPFSGEKAIEVLQVQFEKTPAQLFAAFEAEPLAAGSLGQVHRARHFDGTPLAIKIRRPDVVRDVERDISLMQELALLLDRHVPESRIFDPVGLVNHFARTIRREMNFAREGRTMEEFARLFQGDDILYVPRVYWELTTESVLTMEFVEGARINDPVEMQQIPRTAADIAGDGARIFMKQAFEFGMFHGDPHPGNIRILPNGRVCLLDYGMIGMLEEETREQLVDLLQAIADQNASSAVDVVLRLGEPRGDIDMTLLKVDMRDFIANYYGVELERIDVSRLLSDFVGIMSTHHIRCPGSLMLLIRALVTLEGIGASLDPEFNLAGYLQPFVEKLVKDRYQPRKLAEKIFRDVRMLAGSLHDLPVHLGTALQKLADDDLQVHLDHRGLDHLILELERASNRLVVGMVVAALILASAILIPAGTNTFWVSVPIYLLSSLLAMWLIYGIFRSGRL